MKVILKLEEVALFLGGIYLYSQLPFQWWWFLILILTPDVGMLGYLFGNKIGALCYNIFHHRGLAVLIYGVGIYLQAPIIQLIGIILFSHIAFDRALGFGLKLKKGFKFTHLGEIGNTDG